MLAIIWLHVQEIVKLLSGYFLYKYKMKEADATIRKIKNHTWLTCLNLN